MMGDVSPLLRRALALTVLLGLVATAWLGLVAPLLDAAGEDEERMEHSLKLFAAYRHTAAARPALEAELAALRQREGQLQGVLPGASSALAAAALQTRVKDIVERHGGDIRSAQALPPTAVDGFEAIPVRYELTAPLSALVGILYNIEVGEPYLFLTEAEIAVPDYEPVAQLQEPRLSIRWLVTGYRRPETAP